MTCIAWDGRTMAGDKRVEFAGLSSMTTKVFRVRDGVVGMSGNGAMSNQMRAWYEAGAKANDFPEQQRGRDDWVALLVWRRDGLFLYERTPHPTKIEDKIFAMGCGRDYALAAMHLGKTAREAVEIASVFDINCGNGVDELSLCPP